MQKDVQLTETVSLPPALIGDTASALQTFLFADVRGYTRFTQERGDEAAAALVEKFARLIRDGIKARGGRVIELRGDEAFATFPSARQALRAAVELQAQFAEASEADPALPLAVGIGLDAGEAVAVEDGFRGEVLNLAARLCNLAGPGEILASEGVVYLARRVQGVSYSERGLVPLKGFVEPVRVIRVFGPGDAAEEGDSSLSAATALESALPIGGFLGSLPSGALIDRESEWNRVMGALEAVMQGTGRLVLLSGEPGIGKTRMAQEVTLKARHWGFLVATGRCYEPEQTVPFYPFLEILATMYNAASAFLRAEIPRRWPYLLRLLSDEAGAGGAPFPNGFDPMNGMPIPGKGGPLEGEDQQRLFRAVTGFIEALAETMPVALLLDDLHWADDSSLKLLQHLARYTRGHRVLLLGTYRDVAVNRQHPLELALLDLGREHLLDEIEIRRMGPDGTAALMAEILGVGDDLADLAELVHRRTDGNAFFIQELMRALVDRGDVYRKDGRWVRRAVDEMEVPKSIRSVIGQRLALLEGSAQEILREASLLGQEFTFEDLQAYIALAPVLRDREAWTEDEIEDALEGAKAAGLVREVAPERYAFNHAITQQALFAELSSRRRKRLHLAAGHALSRLPERTRERRAAELAWHFLEGDDAERALPYVMLAGQGAEDVFANGDAERHYSTAVELAHELGDKEREAFALEKLAGILTIRARYDKALHLLEQAADLHRSAENGEGEACAVARMGHVHFLRGTRAEGIARLEAVVQALEGGEPTFGLASLWAALGRLYVNSDQHEQQLKAAEHAVALVRTLGDTPETVRLLIGAEVTRSDALWHLGKEEDTLHIVEHLIPRAEQAGDLDNLTRALSNAALYYGRRGELDKDRAYHERLLELAEKRGDTRNILLGTMSLSQNAYLIGDWNLARSYLERAESAIRSLKSARLATWPMAARGWLALRAGDLETAARYADILAVHARSIDDPDYERLAERLLAVIGLTRGPEHAAAALERLERLRGTPGAAEDIGYLRDLGWAYLEAGNASAALEAVEEAIAGARAARDEPELVESLVVRGMVLGRLKRQSEAVAAFEEARTLAHRLPFPLGEARALHEWSLLEAESDNPAEARRLDVQAAELFERLCASIMGDSAVDHSESDLSTLPSPH